MCKPSWNFGSTRQPNLRFGFLTKIIEKEPCPSIKPDQTPGCAE